jgi:hypothetical protein
MIAACICSTERKVSERAGEGGKRQATYSVARSSLLSEQEVQLMQRLLHQEVLRHVGPDTVLRVEGKGRRVDARLWTSRRRQWRRRHAAGLCTHDERMEGGAIHRLAARHARGEHGAAMV